MTMVYFDPNLPYVQSFEDAVARGTDRITADPGTQRIADQVGARGLANELTRHAYHNANNALAAARHCNHAAGICMGPDSPNVPDAVRQSLENATQCHRATSRRPSL